MSPPEDDAAREASPTCPGPCVKGLTKTHTRQPQPTTASQPVGRYADAWRQGFACGFRDALRLAGRRLPVEHWHTVEELADAYELAAGDG